MTGNDMPRFYIDANDGKNHTQDQEGLDCDDLQVLRHHTLKVLSEVAREAVPDGSDKRDMVAAVRDAAGKFIFTAKLSLTATWLV